MGTTPQGPDPSQEALRSLFEAIFDAHHIDVLAFATRRVDGRAAAEDVVADTFAIVWRKRDAIPEVPLAWLYGIARRVIANQRRSEKRRMRLGDRLAGDRMSQADPACLVETREGIFAAFSRLSESEREVLRLVAWEGVDTRGGAEILECSPVAFRMRLHRARAELKRQLESESPTNARTNPAASAEEA